MRRRLFCSVSPFLRSEIGQQEPTGSRQGSRAVLGSQRIYLTKTEQRENTYKISVLLQIDMNS